MLIVSMFTYIFLFHFLKVYIAKSFEKSGISLSSAQHDEHSISYAYMYMPQWLIFKVLYFLNPRPLCRKECVTISIRPPSLFFWGPGIEANIRVLYTHTLTTDILHIAATPAEDPNAPKPVGPTMQPAVGVPLESRPEWQHNLEGALKHYSTSLAKSPAISIVEPHGKVSVMATYGKEGESVDSGVHTGWGGRSL